jgi:hypothetical protein
LIDGLTRWLAAQLSAEPVDVAVSQDDCGELTFLVFQADDTALRATLRHHCDSDAELLAIANAAFSIAACSWWRAGEASAADVN